MSIDQVFDQIGIQRADIQTPGNLRQYDWPMRTMVVGDTSNVQRQTELIVTKLAERLRELEVPRGRKG